MVYPLPGVFYWRIPDCSLMPSSCSSKMIISLGTILNSFYFSMFSCLLVFFMHHPSLLSLLIYVFSPTDSSGINFRRFHSNRSSLYLPTPETQPRLLKDLLLWHGSSFLSILGGQLVYLQNILLSHIWEVPRWWHYPCSTSWELLFMPKCLHVSHLEGQI